MDPRNGPPSPSIRLGDSIYSFRPIPSVYVTYGGRVGLIFPRRRHHTYMRVNKRPYILPPPNRERIGDSDTHVMEVRTA